MSEQSDQPDALASARGFCDSIERRDFEAALSFFGPDPVWDVSVQATFTSVSRSWPRSWSD
jgi:hypothetical protein